MKEDAGAARCLDYRAPLANRLVCDHMGRVVREFNTRSTALHHMIRCEHAGVRSAAGFDLYGCMSDMEVVLYMANDVLKKRVTGMAAGHYEMHG